MKNFFNVVLSGFLAAALICCTSGVSGEQIFVPAQQLTVFDGRGKFVGRVIDIDETALTLGAGSAPVVVAFRAGGTSFPVEVFRDGFTGYYTVRFESTDCSGQPFIFAGPVPPVPLPLVAVGVSGSTVYVADSGGSPQTIFARSQTGKRYNLPATCEAIDVQDVGIPAQAVVNLNSEFAPPFEVR